MSYKRKNSKGLIVGIIAIFTILLVAVGALGWLSDGFTNWEPSTWIESEEDDTVAEVDTDTNASGYVAIIG